MNFDPRNVTGKYVLDDDGEPREEPDLFKWAAFMESRDRIVLMDRIGAATISTIFLGVDYRFIPRPGAKPILWETMIFGGVLGSLRRHFQRRYTSRLDALVGHAKACELVERVGTPPRRTKKALKKDGRLRPGDRRRVARWLAKVEMCASTAHF